MSIIQSKITRYTKKQEKISPITNKKINQMKDDEMTAMRDLIDKHLKIAIMYVPQMLKNINKTMNMMRRQQKTPTGSKKTIELLEVKAIFERNNIPEGISSRLNAAEEKIRVLEDIPSFPENKT